MENRLSQREHHVELSSTRFYAETAKREVKEWDPEAVEGAKHELCALLRQPGRSIIGELEGCEGGRG